MFCTSIYCIPKIKILKQEWYFIIYIFNYVTAIQNLVVYDIGIQEFRLSGPYYWILLLKLSEVCFYFGEKSKVTVVVKVSLGGKFFLRSYSVSDAISSVCFCQGKTNFGIVLAMPFPLCAFVKGTPILEPGFGVLGGENICQLQFKTIGFCGKFFYH